MLTLLRNLTRSKFAGLIIGLLIVAMAAWGVSDIFSGNLGDSVAKAGSRSISVQTLDKYVDRYVSNARRTNPGLTKQDLADQGQIPFIVDIVLSQETTLAHADAAGTRAPAIAAQDLIRENRSDYQLVIDRGIETPASLEAGLQDDLTQGYYRDASTAGLTIPDAYGAIWADFRQETRNVSYFVLDRSDLETLPEPTEDELRAFYDSRADNLAQPERRAVSLLSFTAEDFLHRVDVSEDEISAEYDAQTRRFSQPPSRRVTQLVFATETAGRIAAGQIAGGTDTDTAAAANDAIDVSELTSRRSEIADPAYAREVFESPVGFIVGPIQVGSTWYVSKIEEEIEGEPIPLEDVREQIDREIRTVRAEEVLYTVFDELDDAIGSGLTLEEIARDLGIPLLQLPPVDRQNRTVDGKFVSTLAGLESAAGLAFDLFANETSDRIDVPDGAFYIRLDKIVPPNTLSFEDVRDDLIAVYADVKADEALQTMAEAISSRVDQGDSTLIGEAAELGKTVQTTPDGLDRTPQPNEAFPATGLTQVFNTAPGKTFIGQLRNGKLIALVHDISLPTTEEREMLLSVGKSERFDELANDLQVALISDIQSSVTVQRNEAQLNAYIQRLRGDE